MTKEKAIELLKEIIDEGWLISDFEKCPAIDACEMAIEALEQEPRKGHWIEHEHSNGISHIECSECSSWFLRAHLLRNSFCPNCGAKMEEVDK